MEEKEFGENLDFYGEPLEEAKMSPDNSRKYSDLLVDKLLDVQELLDKYHKVSDKIGMDGVAKAIAKAHDLLVDAVVDLKKATKIKTKGL